MDLAILPSYGTTVRMKLLLLLGQRELLTGALFLRWLSWFYGILGLAFEGAWFRRV